MVREQLVPRGITDLKILNAFRKVPRHNFLPQKYAASAYEDCPLPIGTGQTISQPYMVALMTQCLELTPEVTVLEVGTGSGYQTAILAELASVVYSVERLQSLTEKAKTVLKDLGYQNIRIKVGDGTIGWSEYAPYDRIIVTAGAPSIPKPLVAQLKAAGELVIPIGGSFNQTLTRARKLKKKIEINQICSCVFVPLMGKHGWKK